MSGIIPHPLRRRTPAAHDVGQRLQVAELDLAKLKHDLWKPERVERRFRSRGPLASTVHNNGPQDLFGEDRWATGAVCRWRNIRAKEL